MAEVIAPKDDTCKKYTTKEFLARKSPPYLARECQGKTKLGNDGHYYTSVFTGVTWRWAPVAQRQPVERASKAIEHERVVPIIQPISEAERKKVQAQREKEQQLREERGTKKLLEEDWIEIKKVSDEDEKKEDIKKLDQYCTILTGLSTDEFKNPVYAKKLQPVFKFLRGLLVKYDIDKKVLSPEVSPTSMRANCKTMRRLIELSMEIEPPPGYKSFAKRNF